MARASVSIFSASGANTGSNVDLPSVFSAPVRHDIVRTTFRDMAKNHRQPYAVSRRSGHQVAAESWGTGRAVARIPRVGGGGTHRSGQGAYGNMCRGGRMFAPTKTYRRWHRRINQNVRRYSVASALAASAIPPLVMARGHKIEKVSEVPLVVADDLQSLKKTKDAVALLSAINAKADVEKAADTKKVRPGKGKARNRRYVTRCGPLVVVARNDGAVKAFANLPGVETATVTALNLLQLAPGGHLGRFIIWSEAAFRALDGLFGAPGKKGVRCNVPRAICANSDITRVINSDEVQSALRPRRAKPTKKAQRRNPLKSKGAMTKLNPHAKAVRKAARAALLAAARKK